MAKPFILVEEPLPLEIKVTINVCRAAGIQTLESSMVFQASECYTVLVEAAQVQATALIERLVDVFIAEEEEMAE